MLLIRTPLCNPSFQIEAVACPASKQSCMLFEPEREVAAAGVARGTARLISILCRLWEALLFVIISELVPIAHPPLLDSTKI